MAVSFLFLMLCSYGVYYARAALPIVVNTFNVPEASDAAWNAITSGSSASEAIVIGCGSCEDGSCMGSVGKGGSPDENGETTLDATIMDGETMDVGSIFCMRDVINAIGVAEAVMKYTEHSVLAGNLARDFALSLGFPQNSLQTNESYDRWQEWLGDDCQPNSRRNVSPDPTQNCGPYTPNPISYLDTSAQAVSADGTRRLSQRYNPYIDKDNHDTIGMVAIDGDGKIAAGCTTNGAGWKVPGRVGDSPVAGSGAYAEKDKGACATSGDGDVIVRLSPCFHAVQLMGQGYNATAAGQAAVARVYKYYPNSGVALVLLDASGGHGGACNEFGGSIGYNVIESSTGERTTETVNCTMGPGNTINQE